jgi:hypothetical protein
MNEELDEADRLDGLDARLARLPAWQPPADFALRLAAAAARERYRMPPQVSRGWAWRRFQAHLPLGIATGSAVLVLASLPWTGLAADPLFTWLVAGAAGSAGIAMTLRLVRAR